MNHKRKRHPNARAGCRMCKPQKSVAGYKGIAHKELASHGGRPGGGFGKIRADIHTRNDMKTLDYG